MNKKEFFEVLTVSRDDIEQVTTPEFADNLTDEQMEEIALCFGDMLMHDYFPAMSDALDKLGYDTNWSA